MKYEWLNSYVYVLRCPESDIVRYVGRTRLPSVRRSTHLSGSGSTPVAQWKVGLQKRDLQPVFEIIETITGCDEKAIQEAKKRENWWIKHYRAQHSDLLNRHLNKTSPIK